MAQRSCTPAWRWDSNSQISACTHPSVRKLMAGNDRYLAGGSVVKAEEESSLRRSLATHGQKPWAVMLSCSDSRVPVERIFDALPGELFVIRAAGNICGSPVGGLLGSAEYAVEHLGSPLVMVLGHTSCGAVSAAVKCAKTGAAPSDTLGRNIGAVVRYIAKPASEALEAERPTTPDQIEHAIWLNVLHEMEELLRWSPVLRKGVFDQTLEVQGGIYDITTGEVTFLGQHPRQDDILTNAPKQVVRTGFDASMPAPDALKLLKDGNARYILGHVENKVVDAQMRMAQAQLGQRPYAAILGCADSRVALDLVFDANPGSLFVLRNAGNTCGAAAGGIIGSIEFGVGHLKTQLLLVLGHTKCGALAAAMDAHLDGGAEGVSEPLQLLLGHVQKPVEQAAAEDPGSERPELVERAIERNVWHTVEKLLAASSALKDAVAEGRLQIHGGVYDLLSGRVNFMGQHPRLGELLADGGGDMHPAARLNLKADWASGQKKDVCCEGCAPPSTPLAVVPTLDSSTSTRAPTKHAWVDEDPEVGWVGAEKDGMWNADVWAEYFQGLLECSMYLETKHGRQHVKDIVLDRNNWFAGITVALVSVPLSISLGIASGTTPTRGVATAVFGGICAATFGDSDYNVVGPAGALSGLMMSYAAQWGDDVLPWIALISSAICFICLVLRLDVYMLMMPKSVFEGFTVGVALIIGLSQINFAFGLTPDKAHKLFVMNVAESLQLLGETRAPSIIVFLFTVPLLWLLMRKLPKIPWTAIVSVLSIPLGVLCDHGHLGLDLLTLKSKYGVLTRELVQPLRPTSASFADLLLPSLSVAIVAVLETLISAKTAAGRVDRGFSQTKEMRGLVVAAAVCGATGAMPPTGFLARTSLNTSLGATHRFAQGLNAVVIAVISLALMPVFSYLPQPTIASVLVASAIGMTPVTYLQALWKEDKFALALCAVTALTCVCADPVIGLAAGMALALLASAKKMLTTNFVDIKSKQAANGKKDYCIEVNGALTYLNAQVFVERTRKLDCASEVVLNLASVRQADHDGISALAKVIQEWVKNEPDCSLKITGIGSSIKGSLAHFDWFTKADRNGQVKTA